MLKLSWFIFLGIWDYKALKFQFPFKIDCMYNSTDRDVLSTKSGELNYENNFDINICSLWV